eukprot:scaffold104136_cov24-Tisochrysis_lutea.AAC.1
MSCRVDARPLPIQSANQSSKPAWVPSANRKTGGSVAARRIVSPHRDPLAITCNAFASDSCARLSCASRAASFSAASSRSVAISSRKEAASARSVSEAAGPTADGAEAGRMARYISRCASNSSTIFCCFTASCRSTSTSANASLTACDAASSCSLSWDSCAVPSRRMVRSSAAFCCCISCTSLNGTKRAEITPDGVERSAGGPDEDAGVRPKGEGVAAGERPPPAAAAAAAMPKRGVGVGAAPAGVGGGGNAPVAAGVAGAPRWPRAERGVSVDVRR